MSQLSTFLEQPLYMEFVEKNYEHWFKGKDTDKEMEDFMESIEKVSRRRGGADISGGTLPPLTHAFSLSLSLSFFLSFSLPRLLAVSSERQQPHLHIFLSIFSFSVRTNI